MPASTLLTARMRVRVLALALALATVVPSAAAAPAAQARKAVPAKDAQAPVLAKLKKEFRAELKSKAPEDRRALAQRFLDLAAEQTDDPVRRYVLLDQAVVLATSGKDVPLALEAVNRIASGFYEFNRAKRAFTAVSAATRSSKDVGLLATAANAHIDVTGYAVAANDPSTARKAIAAAKSLSKKVKMDGLAARAGELAKLVTAFKRAAANFPAIEEALVANSLDPAALAAAGRYSCFVAGDWESGLSFLARSEDEAFGELATTEGKLEGAPERRIIVADGWWEAAQSEKDPLARARMLARAAGHYEILLPDATGEAPDEMRRRLESITYTAWDRSVALTTDFSKYGPANLALATLQAFIAKQKIDKSDDRWRTKLPRFPDITYSPGVDYFWRLQTNQGEITIRFFADTAPQHVTNFLYLTELGFFDGLTFHRVIPGFMAQGGDPTGSGSGGPGYFINGEYDSDRKHEGPGILSMANTGQPKSDGSQFFITFRAAPELNGKHTVFGEVVDGMKTVKKLEERGTPGGPPKTKLVIERATVFMR